MREDYFNTLWNVLVKMNHQIRFTSETVIFSDTVIKEKERNNNTCDRLYSTID